MDFLVTTFTIVISALVSLAGTWAVFHNQKSRNKSQNFHDDMDTARNALEIAELATKKNLELQREFDTFKADMKLALKEKHYKATIVFSIGEVPRVETASIEKIVLPKDVKSLS